MKPRRAWRAASRSASFFKCRREQSGFLSEHLCHVGVQRRAAAARPSAERDQRIQVFAPLFDLRQLCLPRFVTEAFEQQSEYLLGAPVHRGDFVPGTGELHAVFSASIIHCFGEPLAERLERPRVE